MNVDRIERMRVARDIPQVMLQKYNNLRSSCPGVYIFAFEGGDDVPLFDTMITRVRGVMEYRALVCNGKDRVLSLRELLARNTSDDSKLVCYFVDKDFDGLKGGTPGNDIYCTPCYSIENLLIGKDILVRLLCGEYRCNDEDADTDIKRITEAFDCRLAEFNFHMKGVNELIHYARSNNLKTTSIENDIRKYVRVSLDSVQSLRDRKPIWELVGLDGEVAEEDLSVCAPEFNALDPINDWRGKFIYGFFQKFLADVKEDRGKKTPAYFSKRAVVNFSPQGDIIRTLASIAEIPQCLNAFLLNVKSIGDSPSPEVC